MSYAQNAMLHASNNPNDPVAQRQAQYWQEVCRRQAEAQASQAAPPQAAQAAAPPAGAAPQSAQAPAPLFFGSQVHASPGVAHHRMPDVRSPNASTEGFAEESAQPMLGGTRRQMSLPGWW